MTNEEWLNTLSVEKKAKFLARSCNFCSYDCANDYCSENHCEEGIKEWLKKKHIEPMPEIKAGDLVFYSKESYYVALTPDKLVTLRGYVVVDLENAIRKDCIIAVKRYMNGELTTIWGG